MTEKQKSRLKNFSFAVVGVILGYALNILITFFNNKQSNFSEVIKFSDARDIKNGFSDGLPIFIRGTQGVVHDLGELTKYVNTQVVPYFDYIDSKTANKYPTENYKRGLVFFTGQNKGPNLLGKPVNGAYSSVLENGKMTTLLVPAYFKEKNKMVKGKNCRVLDKDKFRTAIEFYFDDGFKDKDIVFDLGHTYP